MFQLKCDNCGKAFNHSYSHTKVCSRECRQERHTRIYFGKSTSNRELPTGSVGAMSEMLAAADLLKKGYNVFRSVSPACYCDLIAIKGDIVWNVEVRTGYMSLKNKITFPSNIRGKTNLFAVCERNTWKVYYLSLDKEVIEI